MQISSCRLALERSYMLLFLNSTDIEEEMVYFLLLFPHKLSLQSHFSVILYYFVQICYNLFCFQEEKIAPSKYFFSYLPKSKSNCTFLGWYACSNSTSQL